MKLSRMSLLALLMVTSLSLLAGASASQTQSSPQASTPKAAQAPQRSQPSPRRMEETHHRGMEPEGAFSRFQHRERMQGRWWKNSDLVKELGINDSQVKRIEQTFQEHRMKLIDLHAELQRQEAQLEPMVEADNFDEAQIAAQIDKITAARGALEKSNALMLMSIRRILTVEQWHKLQALQPPMPHEPMGPMHPGAGPTPPPPPGSFERQPFPPRFD